MIVVHPNNPTGSYIHPEDADGPRQLVSRPRLGADRRRGLSAVSPRWRPRAGDSFAARNDVLTFTLGGLSKSAGLPQLKLAWIVVGGPDDLVDRRPRSSRLHRRRLSLGEHSGGPGRSGSFVAASELVRNAIAARCRNNLEILRDMAAARLPAVTVPPVGGGWSALVRLPAVLDDEEIALRLLTERGVAVQPGFFFDLPTTAPWCSAC